MKPRYEATPLPKLDIEEVYPLFRRAECFFVVRAIDDAARARKVPLLVRDGVDQIFRHSALPSVLEG